MGFRCPRCREDFGLEEDKLKQHFEANPKCKTFGELFYPTIMKKIKKVNSPDDYEPNFELGDDAFP